MPHSLCGPLLRFLVRALTREAREDGGVIPAGLTAFMKDLQAAQALADDGQVSDPGEKIEEVRVMRTAAQLAELSGWSPRTLRRWAASGRVRAWLVGRTWLIDPDSLAAQQEVTRCQM